ncbi:MAG: MFS transporter [Alphaproteobacteria bacterium]|tara:strand:- start:1749 stop:2948 length:1200 start_codon:yes stop_codon:yes gene_type:complete
MLSVLSEKSFRNLFFAQNFSLLGSGLATIAISLLAFDLTGRNAALILSGLFTIKMFVYVIFSPFAGAIADKFDTKKYLIIQDVIRAIAACGLIFVSEIWHLYIIIVLIYLSTAAFTPIYQSAIPKIFKDETDYTKAISLFRIAQDMENILSYALATLLLLFLNYNLLFVGTFIGYFVSALLISGIIFPFLSKTSGKKENNFNTNLTLGIKRYLSISELKGLMFLNLAVSAGGSMILVNTIILVRSSLELSEIAFSITMLIFGAGCIFAAIIIPYLSKEMTASRIMLAGSNLLSLVFVTLAFWLILFDFIWFVLLAAWFISGFGYTLLLTPMGRVIRKVSSVDEFSQVYSAQFSLSHLCWLFMYPLSGYLMTISGASFTLLTLALLMVCSNIIAAWYIRS